MKKWSETKRKSILKRDQLREKWRRELLKRRVDAKGMEPIRLRVRTLLRERSHATHKVSR